MATSALEQRLSELSLMGMPIMEMFIFHDVIPEMTKYQRPPSFEATKLKITDIRMLGLLESGIQVSGQVTKPIISYLSEIFDMSYEEGFLLDRLDYNSPKTWARMPGGEAALAWFEALDAITTPGKLDGTTLTIDVDSGQEPSWDVYSVEGGGIAIQRPSADTGRIITTLSSVSAIEKIAQQTFDSL